VVKINKGGLFLKNHPPRPPNASKSELTCPTNDYLGQQCGDLRELYLPRRWLDGKRKAESLGSIIDRGTNQTALAIKAAHPELCKKAEQPENPEKPTTEATPATLAWAGDNPRRLAAALLKIYREDPTLQPELEKWRKHHFHLLRYKKGLNDKLIRIRREIYRKFVSDLAKKYSICGIEDFDLRQVTTKDQAHELVKWQRTAAGISSPQRQRYLGSRNDAALEQ
jgi:hypothetical protein